MLKIMVVEDDPSIRKLIIHYLLRQGYQIVEAENGNKAYEIFQNEHLDLVITDVMMPIMDGFTLSSKIRSVNVDIPILMLTALETYSDKEKGFMSGADDYIVKPFDMNEMMLRIKSLLRRYKIASENKIVMPHITLDYKSSTCVMNQESIELTRKEFLLLFKLLSSPNQIFTREQLMNEIWGFDSESYDRTVDTHIKRLREQINCEDYTIVTVRGLGYKAVVK